MSQRIKAYFRSLLCRAASWFKYRRPVLVRRYVLIERDTLQEELDQVHDWLWDASKDAASLGKRLNEKIDECDQLRRQVEELSKTERVLDDAREEEYQKRLQAERIGELWRQSAHQWNSNYDHACKIMEDERSAAAAQIKSLEGQLNSAIIEAAELQRKRDEEEAEHNKTFGRLLNVERAYAKCRRALEDVKKAVEVAS